MSGWRDKAECLGVDPELFHHADGSRLSHAHINRIVGMFCDQCEVRPECLNLGLSLHADGIWGGKNLNENTRSRLRRAL